MLTYAAYAGRLVAEHALRIGAEPDARLISPAVAWQLADAVSRRYPDELPADIGAPSSIPRYVLAMAGQFADHLVDPAQVDDVLHGDRASGSRRCRYGARHQLRRAPATTGKLLTSLEHRARAAAARRGVRAGQGGAAGRGLRRPDARGGARSPASRRCSGPSASGSRPCCSTSTRTPVTLRSRRLSGLFGQGHPVTAVGDPLQSIYGWRGRQRRQHRPVRDHVPDAPTAGPRRRVPARDQLPQRPG